MENLTITLLVAIAENGVIGVNNSLPWHISDDLKRFKAITTGHSIIMGRKTYESFPKRPLPNRKNIVLSNSCKEIEGAFVAKDINEALKLCDSQEVFIIGGATIYEQFIDIADKIYLTKVHKSYDGDAFFTKIDESEWIRTSVEEHLESEPPFSYINLERKNHK